MNVHALRACALLLLLPFKIGKCLAGRLRRAKRGSIEQRLQHVALTASTAPIVLMQLPLAQMPRRALDQKFVTPAALAIVYMTGETFDGICDVLVFRPATV